MKKQNLIFLIINIVILITTIVFTTYFRQNFNKNNKENYSAIPFSLINETVQKYNVFSYLRETEFTDKIKIDDALMYFVIKELNNPEDKNSIYHKYIINEDELTIFEIPKDIVDDYLNKHFFKIDYSECSKCKENSYILPASAIGDFPYDYNITNILEKDNEF